MTAPRVGEADLSSAGYRPARAGTAAPALVILLLLGLLLRLTIAYVMLPGSGFESDIGTFSAWARALYHEGPGTFYADNWSDYPPGYLYVLWLGSHLAALLHGGNIDAVSSDALKLGPILADIGVGALLFMLVRAWAGGSRRGAGLGLAAAGLYLFNPVTWYDSAVWGQVDAVGALIVLLGLAALARGNSEGAMALAVLAGLIKPQFGILLGPLVVAVLLRRHLLAPGSGPRHRPLVPAPLRSWFEEEHGVWRLLSSATIGLIVLLALITPFSLDLRGLIAKVLEAAAGYQYLTVNAYNPWALIGSDGRPPLADGGGWSPDDVPLFGPLPAMVVGTLLLAVGFGIGLVRAAWRDDRRSLVVVAIFLAFCFFMLPTRVHERYLFPVFALLPLLAAADRRWLLAMVAVSVGSFINLHGILTIPLYATPNLETLPLGEAFRQREWVVASVLLQAATFAFVAWQLRPSVAGRPLPLGEQDDEDRAAAGTARTEPAASPLAQPAPEAAPVAPGALAMPGIGRRLSPMLDVVPMRRDRSGQLADEPGGRLDRLDLLLLVAVFVATLGLRTLRIEQPYHMHFDEVYHARTATEFLQHWRYDIRHSIYEWTHPHLAKYAMALSIDWLGNNRVVDVAELGTPVTAAAIEERWAPGDAPTVRNGDRLYVAGPAELRAYDLLGRRLQATIGLPVVALAVDDSTHTLFLGQRDGQLWRVSTEELDAVRAGGGGSAELNAEPLTALGGMSGPLVSLTAAADRLIAVAGTGELISLDPATGEETGRRVIAGAAEVAAVEGGDRLVVDTALVDDREALLIALATVLGEGQGTLRARLADRSGRVVLAGYLDEDDKAAVEEAIANDELPAASVESGAALAVAAADGVELVDAHTLDELLVLRTGAPVTGFALVERAVEKPTLYAASGSNIQLVRVPTDEPPALADRLPMPGAVADAVWNPSTELVHVLGRPRDGVGNTVYAIEPHGNAVFADAPLPFEPAALVMDAQPRRPADDRLDLLALSVDGRQATVDVGSNSFAWRFPGVLLGALMAACIYLLARFLFRRRSVAVFASILVLADGMMFANTRIAMNDAYIAFFIVAAMTLFAPLWLGRWRSPLAVGGGILGVAVLLGLALASKWVGLYALGAVVLLIVVRSALGRLLALAGMVATTALLGYLAIAPAAAGTGQANYPFLLLMIALTCALVVAMAVRPIRLTIDELRLAVAGPVVGGLLVLAAGAWLSAIGAGEGALLTPGLLFVAGVALIVVGAAVFGVARLARSHGRGPLVEDRLTDDSGEPPAPPPPPGWLRPGSGPLALPWLAALGTLVIVPLAIYVLSYAPWVALGNRYTSEIPPGATGQTLIELTKQMYDYHNNLRATHPAASPWWAWPLDLKPVWFEQTDYAGTTGVIYDTGNLVIFWLAIPAFAFACFQAWRRRSLALGLLVLTVLCLWLPWARIDRATFQYHFFTTLPFSILCLAYFLAELWHGPSRRTWLLARASAAVAIVGPAALWLLRQPLCGIAGTEQANPGTEVCGALSRQMVLTNLQLFAGVLTFVGLGLIVWLLWFSAGRWRWVDEHRLLLLPVAIALAAAGMLLALVGAALPGEPVFQAQISAFEVPLLVLLLLAVPAYYVLRARDPRRFAVSALVAAALWFVLWFPNISGLPVPGPISQVHLGLLPTYNWAFQFAVNQDEPTHGIDWMSVVMLGVVMLMLVAAAFYAARSWREQRAAARVLTFDQPPA
ncbi:MAG: phospholipid carrier-dependent glycosyltransferase [Chloroflexota bacterium]|nr:phospholipid carrier-dependent glycosyltransferase [Chloroflexota bacterium]